MQRIIINIFFFTMMVWHESIAANILMINPGLSKSTASHIFRMGNVLSRAGHNITHLVPIADADIDSILKLIDPNSHVIKFYPFTRGEFEEMKKMQSEMIFRNIQMWDPSFRNQMSSMMEKMEYICKINIMDKTVMNALRATTFDVAFAHMYNLCPFGLIHMLKIPSTIWLSSSVLTEIIAYTIGIPPLPSFVPGSMSGFSDEMNLYERTMNFLGAAVVVPLFTKLNLNMQSVFTEAIGDDFPSLLDLARDQTQLVFVNSIELIDFPRPYMAKVIDIGGFDLSESKPLSEEWQQVLSKGKNGAILFSLGSVVHSYLMPIEWKQAIFSLPNNFPDYQFILKYESDDVVKGQVPGVTLPANLYISKWVPQTDLLAHPSLKLFITHGGYNSLLETSYAGKPVIAIPLFGDQYRNARLTEKHGFGISFDKSTLSIHTLTTTVRAILSDHSFAKNATKMSKMLHKRPLNSKELIIKWTDFLAEFKTLPNLDPVSKRLTFVQIYSLDSIAIILALLTIVLITIFLLLRSLLRCLCRCVTKKAKRE